MLRAVRGQVAPALVLGVAAFDPSQVPLDQGPEVHVHELREDEPASDHEHAHHHDGHHAHEYWTWSFRSERPLSARRLRRAVDELPETVVRAKGTVLLASHPRRRAVMHVVGRRAELCLDEPWGDREPTTGLVLIGAGEPLSPRRLEELFRACEVDPGETGAAGAVMRWVRRVLPSKESSAG